MSEKKKPTGFVAICQCGNKIGAMDYTRTDRKDAGKLLGEWLADGCIIEPRFEGSWSEKITQCDCDEEIMDDATRYAHGAM